MTPPPSGAPAGACGTASTPYDTDVVVIGAGPVGLTLAGELAHHGVRFRLFEERTEPRRHSRANNVWSRPQELLAGAGAECLFDLDGAAHAAYGLDSTAAVVLVRPDGHIAFRAPVDRANALAQYCERLAGADRVTAVSSA